MWTDFLAPSQSVFNQRVKPNGDGYGAGQGATMNTGAGLSPSPPGDPLKGDGYGTSHNIERLTLLMFNPTPDDFRAIVIYAQLLQEK